MLACFIAGGLLPNVFNIYLQSTCFVIQPAPWLFSTDQLCHRHLAHSSIADATSVFELIINE